MRETGCPRCQNRLLLFVRQIADRIGDMGGEKIERGEMPVEPGQYEPWRIARQRYPEASWLTHGLQAAGLVQAYICRECGYTELYTVDPKSIPVDGDMVVEIEAPGQAPYR